MKLTVYLRTLAAIATGASATFSDKCSFLGADNSIENGPTISYACEIWHRGADTWCTTLGLNNCLANVNGYLRAEPRYVIIWPPKHAQRTFH